MYISFRPQVNNCMQPCTPCKDYFLSNKIWMRIVMIELNTNLLIRSGTGHE